VKILKLCFAVVTFALLVNSCNNPFGLSDASPSGNPPAGKGSFSLKINGAERTIVPADKAFANENLVYKLIFTPTGANGTLKTVNRTYNNLGEPVVLDLGTYNLVVNAYDANDNLLFTGTADNIDITEDVPATAEVTLQPVTGGGTGTFSWDITLSNSVISVDMVIKNKITLYNTTIDATAGTLNLPAGFYDVIITMTGINPSVGYITVTQKEILHIYNGYESVYTPDFTGINFDFVYTVTLQLDKQNAIVPKFVHGQKIPQDYFSNGVLNNLPNDAYLCVGDNLSSVPGYTVEGLYHDEDYQQEWEMDNDVVTKDITLHAKLGGPIDVSRYDGADTLGRVVDYLDALTTAGDYTLFIADNVTLTQQLTVQTNVNLTIKSVPDGPYTIIRDFEGTGYSGMLVVYGNAELTLENIIIDGQKEKSGFLELPLVSNTGTFTMNADAVLRNNKGISGAGVNVNGGTFTMNGGLISGNEAINYGGGVYNTGNFTMNGGTISNNTAFDGGGVYNSGTLILDGIAQIKDNKNSSDSDDNLLLADSSPITLGAALSDPAEIGVQIKIYVSSYTNITTGVIVSADATQDHLQYFHSDDENKFVVWQKSGKLLIADGVIDKTDLSTKVAAYEIATNDVILCVANNLTLSSNITVPINTQNKTLTITSAPNTTRTISREIADETAANGLFMVSSGAKLVFENIEIDGNYKDTDGNENSAFTSNAASLVRVASGGEFTLEDGAVLKNNRAISGGAVYSEGSFTMNGTAKISGNEVSSSTDSTYGGGVYVRSGDFTMNNGEIFDNTVSSSYNSGAPKHVYGGGVYVYGGSFTMNSGTINNNYLFSNYSKLGGGVYMYGGTFTMIGGEISDHDTVGVLMGGGTFTMDGGEILRNNGGVSVGSGTTFEMTGGKISGNITTGIGGGVCVSNGTFTMSGGEISGNEAAGSGDGFTGNGGGVSVNGSVTSPGIFTMTGGTIGDNEAALNGGGVYIYGGSFSMTGGTIGSNDTVAEGNTAISGGGVYITSTGAENESTFTMSGGKVSGNKANITNENPLINNGGGVYLNGTGTTFNMTGGTIGAGNIAAYSGGGVYVDNQSTFTMNGGEVLGNTATYGGGVMPVSSATFRMITGTVYGSLKQDAITPEEDNLKNTANNSSGGAALYCDSALAYYGNGTDSIPRPTYPARDTTISVVDGVLQE